MSFLLVQCYYKRKRKLNLFILDRSISSQLFSSISSVHPCDKAESPCKNEGVCEKDGDLIICKCTDDWTGDTCETKGKKILS